MTRRIAAENHHTLWIAPIAVTAVGKVTVNMYEAWRAARTRIVHGYHAPKLYVAPITAIAL